MSGTEIAFDPLVPLWLLAGFAVLALLATGYAALQRARGWPWRGLAFAVLIALIANPAILQEQREPVTDVLTVIVDRSPSQSIGRRADRTDAALSALREQLDAFDQLDVRVVEIGTGGEAINETLLIEAAEASFADVPLRRRAGAILITDGQVHDIPEAADAYGDRLGPVHSLLTGERRSTDRRLVLVDAPRYGLVGKEVSITFRIEQDGIEVPEGTPASVAVSLLQNGAASRIVQAPVGQDITIDVPVDTGGQNVFELAATALPEELTAGNNKLAVLVNGVRERLRVLLVSGQPHNGERTWRNLLKSDPSVDLVHFTILRPPDKQDGTPTRELSLIAFPIRELFEIKLYDFDLIIFDSYKRHGVLPDLYLRNITEYVMRGGALLEANGLHFARGRSSLYYTALGSILPGAPSGDIVRSPFKPTPTKAGLRHPVTADLSGLPPPSAAPEAEPEWGRWLHQVDVAWQRGNVLLNGESERPLLLLDRVGEGRVAQLTSDHIWLWSRGYDGGGPQVELLRRLAHWLMKEPELEENRLSASAEGRTITVRRRSLEADPRVISIRTPSGETETLGLEDEARGWASGSYRADELGLYRFDDGERTTYATVGRINPPELMDVRSTDELVKPIAEASGGGVFWLAGRGDDIPELRRSNADGRQSGSDWMGIRRNGEYVVSGVQKTSLLPVVLALMLGLGGIVLAWHREGR